MMRLPWWLLLLLCAPALASAAPAYVLRIEGADAFVDLGRAQSAYPGARLRVYRVVEVRHPLTGKALKDRFLLGEVEVVEAGETLSRIALPDELLSSLEVGDEVEPLQPIAPPERPAESRPAELRPVEQPSGAPPSAAAPSDAERTALRAAWNAAVKVPAAERARVWEEFLAAWPKSDLAGPIRAEVSLLREAAARPAGRRVESVVRVESVLEVSAPSRALTDEPLTFTVARKAGPAPRAAMVHWRVQGTPTFRTLHLQAEPTGHFRTALPQGSAAEPALEYYVEAVEADGSTRAVAGTAATPRKIAIVRPPRDELVDTRSRSRVRIFNEYVDFNRFRGNDVYNFFEADFLYRLYTALHAVRMGFGNYQGTGTPRALLDAGVPGQPVGFTYGFTELELRLDPAFSVLLKGSIGVNQQGLNGGFDLGVRFGSETGTSLLVRGATIANIGQRAGLTLAWDAVEGWPMSAEVAVTNEPIGTDLGVRLVYSVGRSITPWLDITGRVGYQLRDINHSGLSLGLGTSFHW